MSLPSLLGFDLAINTNASANQIGAQILARSDGGAFVYWLVPGAAASVQGRMITATGGASTNDFYVRIDAQNLTATALPNGAVELAARNGNTFESANIGADGLAGVSTSSTFTDRTLTGGPVVGSLSDGRVAFFIETSGGTQYSLAQPGNEYFDDFMLNNGSSVSARDSNGAYWNVIGAAGIGASEMAIATERGSGSSAQISFHLVSASTLSDTSGPIGVSLGSSYRDGSFKLTTTTSNEFLASWIDGTTLKAELFNASGQAVGQLMQANGLAPNNVSVTLAPDGSVLMFWDDKVSSQYDIYGQWFSASGASESTSFLVNRNTAGDQTSPSAALLGDGDILVVWNTAITTREDTNGRLVSVTRPDAVDDFVNATAGHALGLPLTANDHDPNGDAISILSLGTPGHGTVTLQDGVAVYKANAGTTGRDSFTYTLQDSHGLTDTATVFVTIHGASTDFNGDGIGDILWRNSGGYLTEWLGTSTGGFTSNEVNAGTGAADSSWQIAGIGDFNGDGRTDVLWRNTSSGFVTDWLGNANGGLNDNSGNALSSAADANWQVAGVGDFNGDGISDVLWRNITTGFVTEWLGSLNGSLSPNPSYHGAGSADTTWQIAAIGDFNGDGWSDIVWRNTSSGYVTDWISAGSGMFFFNHQYAGSGAADNSWQVVGSGDFNGDGVADLLWRNTQSGYVTDWLGTSSGGFTSNESNAGNGSADTNWSVVSIGDFNGDGRSDILWRNSSGYTTEWLGTANGGFLSNEASAGTGSADSNWHVQNPFL